MASLFREYLWLWVILVVLLLSSIISLFFVCLNKWITRRGKQMLVLDKRAPPVFEKYHSPIMQNVPTLKLSTPPLPPRTQFMNEVAEAQSYENLAEGPDYEEPDEPTPHDYGWDNDTSSPEYLKLESGPVPPLYQQEEAGDSDYDDITAEEEKEEEEEDYDDVG